MEISGRKGILVGGEISAGTEILAYRIGNETGLATKLCLRTRDDVLKDEAVLRQEEEKTEMNWCSCRMHIRISAGNIPKRPGM